MTELRQVTVTEKRDLTYSDSSTNETPDETRVGAASKRPHWWSTKPKAPLDAERAGYQALGRAIVGGGLIFIMVAGAWLFTVIDGWANG